jgi:hypothetical protein
MDNIVDYTNEGFTIPIVKDGVKGYASVHSLLYREEDGLDVTGNYFVYLLDPKFGSAQFTLERTTAKSMPWKKVDAPFWVEKETVIQIIAQIELKETKSEVNRG